MKAKYLVVALLVVVLALAGAGCKATGGGWFTNTAFDQPQNKISFGFNAQGSWDEGAVKGQFQLVEHGKPPTKVHGTFDGFQGTCFVNGEGPYPFDFYCMDSGEPGPSAGDFVSIYVYTDTTLYYEGYLEGGNIQYHPAKPE